MPFSLLSKIDQKKGFIKRHPIGIPLITFIFLTIAITIITKEVSPQLIGVVPIDGIVLESEVVIKKLLILENNKDVRGIILRINSPGGAVAPAQEIFTELKRVKKQKKIYTSISSVAASGGYYIAVGSSKIFANPGSLTGSIGVILQSYNIEELMKKIGVKSQVVKSGIRKDIGSLYRAMEPEEQKLLKSVIDDTHEQFVDAIVGSRQLDRAKVSNLADGRIFTGNQALEAGLIDGLASFREVVGLMKKELGLTEKIELFYPELPKDPLWEQFNLESILEIKDIATRTGLFYMSEYFQNLHQ